MIFCETREEKRSDRDWHCDTCRVEVAQFDLFSLLISFIQLTQSSWAFETNTQFPAALKQMGCLRRHKSTRSTYHATIKILRKENAVPVVILRELPRKCCFCPEHEANKYDLKLVDIKDNSLKKIFANLIELVEKKKSKENCLIKSLNSFINEINQKVKNKSSCRGFFFFYLLEVEPKWKNLNKVSYAKVSTGVVLSWMKWIGWTFDSTWSIIKRAAWLMNSMTVKSSDVSWILLESLD